MTRRHDARLLLGLIKMIAENNIHEIGLGNSKLIGCPFDKYLIVVRNYQLFVFVWEGPGAYVAIQCTASAGVALDVVALFTKRLPIAQIIGATPRARDFVVGAELYIWLLQTTRSTPMAVLLLEAFPFRLCQLCPWLAFLAYIQTLKLIADAFLSDRSETFLALQFPHPAENVFVGRLAVLVAKRIHSIANIFFGQHWPRNAVTRWPQCPQEHRVVTLVCRAAGNKAGLGLGEPLLPSLLGLIGSDFRSKKKPFAGAGFGHLVAGL